MKKPTTLILILLFPLFGFAQKTLKDWAELDEKKWNKQLTFNSNLVNLKRYVKSEDQVPKLNNVGLLTYYMFTPNPTVRNINILWPITLGSENEELMVNKLFDIAFPALVSGFQKKGITLFSINEYLDTNEKKALYENTKFEASALGKGTAAWAASLSGRDKRGDARPTPDDYKLIVETNWDIKLSRTIGDFTKKVDMDAVVSIRQQISWDGKLLYLGPITMDIIGPNPVPYNEDDWYAPMGPLKGYLEGFIFGAVIVAPPEGYKVGEIKDVKKGNYVDFTDLDLIYTRVAQSLVDYVNKEIDKLVK